mmetsp:Transcript_44001/g.95617  ORF Transcript_44001/g.95617 Transcript_44001/m.95617 type:complete len:186 (+) Transcript_44001:72-629(+)
MAELPVLVRKLSGALVAELLMEKMQLVVALKVAIADAGGPPASDQQLIVGHQVLDDSEVLGDVLLDGQVFLLTVQGCPSCQNPKGCRCTMCGHVKPGLVDYYGVCQDCGKCGGHQSKCPFCIQVFPSLCALDVHVRFLHKEREAAEWQTSRLEEYIKLRRQPGARRAAHPEPGTFTMALNGGLGA